VGWTGKVFGWRGQSISGGGGEVAMGVGQGVVQEAISKTKDKKHKAGNVWDFSERQMQKSR